jgi:hypothetical protein
MNSQSILILILTFSVFALTKAQDQIWNVHHHNDLSRTIGSQLIETDSFYYNIGKAIDTFPTLEQGVFISKIDKRTGKNIAHQYYGELDTDFSFTTLRNVILEGDFIIFPLTKGFSGGFIHLFKTNIHTLEIEKLLVIPSPELEDNFLFLEDFLNIGDYYYLLNIIQTEKFNEPLIIKIGKQDLSIQYIRFKDKMENITSYRFMPYQDGIIVFSSFDGANIVTGGRLITYLSLDGDMIWENKSPSTVPNYYVLSLLPVTDHEILINAIDPIYDYVKHDVYMRHSVMRFDLITKNSVWHAWWDEPRITNLFGEGRLVRGHREGEILLMSNDVYESKEYDTIYYSGKVVKFDLSGQKIWQKKYSYYQKHNIFNNFYNMIATEDGNYLICGFEGFQQNSWLVKIDEDGNILPIDTTTMTVDWIVPNSTSEIKIYPNPAADYIIINQGEISDIKYVISNMNGQTIKQMTVAQAHHNTIWDISDLPKSTYVISMVQGGKVIGQIKQIVVR